MINFIKNISPTEVAIIVIVFIFFFGARKVTSLGKMSGEVVKEIKNIKKEFTEAVEDDGKSKNERKGVQK